MKRLSTSGSHRSAVSSGVSSWRENNAHFWSRSESAANCGGEERSNLERNSRGKVLVEEEREKRVFAAEAEEGPISGEVGKGVGVGGKGGKKRLEGDDGIRVEFEEEAEEEEDG